MSNPYESPADFRVKDKSPPGPVNITGRAALIVVALAAFAAIGQFNRFAITVAGSDVFIGESLAEQASNPQPDPEREEEMRRRQPLARSLTEYQMGCVYTAFLIVYTCAMLPGGWFIDRVGPAAAMSWFGWTMGVFVVLTGVVGWVATDGWSLWVALLVVRSLAGFCSAPLHPGAARMVSDAVPPSGRSFGNGAITAGAVVGISLGYPIFGPALRTVEWPVAFAVSGVVMIVFTCGWWLFTRREHAEHLARVATPTKSEGLATVVPPALWLLTLSYAAYSYFQYLMFYWMGHYFKNVLFVEPRSAEQAVFLITLAQGGGMFVGGFVTDLLSRWLGTATARRTVMIATMTGCGAVGAFAVNQKSWEEVALWMGVAMSLQGMCEGIYWATATDIGRRRAGFAGAFLNTGGNIGGFISPFVTPVLKERIGWPNAIAVACAICAVGGLIWIAIHPVPEGADAELDKSEPTG